MSSAETRVRNIGIVAHINAGKTTLSERILFTTGQQRVMGEVDDGTATMDFLAEEQRRGISIAAAVSRVEWKGFRLNLIDTPGHVDFTAEVERSLRVLDGVVVVLDGVKGVESQTEVVWRQAAARRIPRLVFVNKMDRPGADFERCLQSLRERLDCTGVPVILPLREHGELRGLAGVISGRTQSFEEPSVEAPDLGPLRTAVIEACADVDEQIMTDFLEDRAIEPDRLHAALRVGVLRSAVVPVLAGAALPNRGVDALLDAICRYLPSPLDIGPVQSLEEGPPQRRSPSRTEPLCALVFKSLTDGDEFVHLARVYSGVLRPGDRVASDGDPEAEPFVAKALLALQGERHEPLSRALPGDVVAIESDAPLRTGDTLFAPGWPMRLEPVTFPQPVLTVAVEPSTLDDAAVVERGAQDLARDDPTLVCTRERDSGRLLVSGMGELHLEVFGSRLRRRVGDRVRLGRPTVALLETVGGTGRATAECRAGGEGSARAVVTVEIEARPEGEGARVESLVEDHPACDGLLEEMAYRLRSGVTVPYPATDLVLRLLEVDGDATGEEGGLLYLEALAVALRKAAAAAGPVTLEPLMSVAVECPADTLSGVLADLRSREADIESVESAVSHSEVRGSATLASLLGYATRLRSLTRASAPSPCGPEASPAWGLPRREKARPVLDRPPLHR